MQQTVNRSNGNYTRGDDRIMEMIGNFEGSVRLFSSSTNSVRYGGNELTDLLNNASRINAFMLRNPMQGRTASQWVLIRNDVNKLAGYYRVSWDWNAAVTPPIIAVYSSTDVQLRNLIDSIETKTNNFKREMNKTLDNSRINNTSREDSINAYIRDFENATDHLKINFDSHRSTLADANEVLTRGRNIDAFMSSNRLNRTAQVQWEYLRNDLNTLATYYRVSWNWNERNPIGQGGTFPNGRLENRLTGTFRLNTSMSDNVDNVVNKSLGVYTSNQRDRVRQNLIRRLRSPEMIAIDTNGQTVDLASSNVPKVTFDADGIGRSETNARGKTVTTTATLNRNGLMINYEGDRVNDFYVTFAPGTNGRLNVSRRIYLENRNETITVSSVYDRVYNDAQWAGGQ